MTNIGTKTAIKETFNNVEVTIIADELPPLNIQSIVEVDEADLSNSIPGVSKTSGGLITTALDHVGLRDVVKSVVRGFGEDMISIQKNLGTSEIELELSLGLAGDTWLFVKAEGHVKLTMTWKNNSTKE